ncbi:MAG TPA: AI-2E family transporter [Oceanospirillales bacterium]|nr:AI-2E family transporter [Oceanospirillaceae bacterium]HBS41953.1 AI-2E family transporter [Oceanospirillales bacterium]|tara:strand:+ start:2660 stop:3727 length:1068 start_codon:yes stop_codon:yes gene_type:complete
MYDVFRRWIDRYFSDEEALILLLLLSGLLLLVLFMGQVLAPFLVAVVVSYLLQGVVNAFKKRGVSHLTATTVVFLLFMAIMLAFLLVVLPATWKQLVEFVYEVPRMAQDGQDLLMLLPERYPDLVSMEQAVEWSKQIREEVTSLGQLVLTSSVSGITGVVTVLIYCVLVPILVFFFLKDSHQIIKWLTDFLPRKRYLLNNVWTEMDLQIANYIRGKSVEIVIVGGISYITFVIFGLNYAALLALLVGISVLIPYIGATVVTVPIALVGYMQWGWSDIFMWLMLAYLIIQALDGNVLVPLLFSEVVNLHPVAIIFAVLVFGGLWGFWGVFFAIPLATLFKAVVTAWPVSHAAGEED